MTSFTQIPVNLLTPGVYLEYDASRATGGLMRPRYRAVLIGQRLATGTIAAATLTRVTGQDARALFGQGSQLARMASAWQKNDRNIDLWAVALDDLGAGVAATKTLTYTGTVTAGGVHDLKIAGVQVRVGITAGQTVTQIATGVAAAVNALPDLPVTAASAAGVVTLTARHKGLNGNGLDVRELTIAGETKPAGLALTIAAGTAGAGNPEVTAALAAVGDEPFSAIVSAWTDATNLTALTAWQAERSEALNQLDGLIYGAAVGGLATLTTLGEAHNSEFLTVIGDDQAPTPSEELASAYAAQVTAAAADDPGRPFTTLVLTGVQGADEGERFDRQERQYLLEAGISTLVVDASGNVTIDRAVTTYKRTGAGFEDNAYQDVNALLLLFYLRWSVRARFATKYPRHKLGNDGGNYGATQAIVTPKILKAELIALFADWESAALVENSSQFKNDLVVERDANDRNRVNAIIPPDLINQFLVFAGLIQFRR